MIKLNGFQIVHHFVGCLILGIGFRLGWQAGEIFLRWLRW